MDMQLVTVNSDQLAGGREFLPVVPGGNGLIDHAHDGHRDKQHEEPESNTPYPANTLRLTPFFVSLGEIFIRRHDV
jgi:hypothetical protein